MTNPGWPRLAAKPSRSSLISCVSCHITTPTGSFSWNRHIQEVVRSQNRMLTRRGEELSGDDQKVSALFEQHLRSIQPWLRNQQNFSVLDLHYSEVVNDPLGGAAQIAGFLKTDLDQQRMASVVDPGLYRNRA